MAGKKDNYDYTSGQRAAKHLERLTQGKGKRLPIDFDGPHVQILEDLIADGYGKTAAAVIRKAIADVHSRLRAGQNE